MSRGKASGYKLNKNDARIVLGMVGRGDRHHDIAAWFGVNQGRIAEVQEGSFGGISAASSNELPPKGPPGIKGRRLHSRVGAIVSKLENAEIQQEDAVSALIDALAEYDGHEA